MKNKKGAKVRRHFLHGEVSALPVSTLAAIILISVAIMAFASISPPSWASTSLNKSLLANELKITDGENPVNFRGMGPVSNIDLVRKIPISLQALSPTNIFIQRDSGEFHNFLKEYQVNWKIPDEWDLKFAWGSRQENIASAVWQISVLRFSPDTSVWDKVPGLVASGQASVKDVQPGDNPHVFMVDFGALTPKPQGKLFIPIVSTMQSQPPKTTQLRTSTGTPQPVLKTVPKITNLKPLPQKPGNILNLSKDRDSISIPYYVRVVPLDKNGEPAGLPSEPVVIYWGDPFPDGNIEVFPETFQKPEAIHPQVLALSYEPIQQEAPDAMYHVIAVRDISMFWKKGDKLDLTPRPGTKNALDYIGDAISSVVDFVSGALNWISTAYESIKEYAVDAACSIAGERFRGAFEMGLNIGLAAIGLPPNIPNFDELTSMGADYLVAVIVEESIGLGVDPVLAQQAAEEGVEAFIREARNQGNGGGDPGVFFKPDPDYYYRPAYMDVIVKNNESEATTPMIGLIRITVKDGTWDEYLFDRARFSIPSLAPGEILSLRVFLRENMQNVFGDTNPYSGMHRFWSRYQMPAKVEVLSAAYAPSDPERPANADYKYANPEVLWQQFNIPAPGKPVKP